MKSILVCIVCFVLFAHAQAPIARVRGQVVTVNPASKKEVPFPNVSVALYRQVQSKWELVAQTVTNPSGYYYFSNIQQGTYSLQVRKSKNYTINVVATNGTAQFDVPLIVFE